MDEWRGRSHQGCGWCVVVHSLAVLLVGGLLELGCGLAEPRSDDPSTLPTTSLDVAHPGAQLAVPGRMRGGHGGCGAGGTGGGNGTGGMTTTGSGGMTTGAGGDQTTDGGGTTGGAAGGAGDGGVCPACPAQLQPCNQQDLICSYPIGTPCFIYPFQSALCMCNGGVWNCLL